MANLPMRFTFLALFFAFNLSGASAATYYVLAGHTGGTGMQDNPWPTVQQAADVAKAGDTVVIQDGKYPEDIIVKNSGTQAHPITFMAQNNKGAELFSIQPHLDSKAKLDADWVTVQGINFNIPGPHPQTAFIEAGTGWTFLDCMIQGNNQLSMPGDQKVNLGNITINHCIFQDCRASVLYTTYNRGTNAFGGYAGQTTPSDLLHDVLISNSIVRRSNLNNNNPNWDSGAFKFCNTRNVTLDGLISYDNNGFGMWLDTNNQNFIIKNCSVYGNHTGWGYYCSTDPKGVYTLWDNSTFSGALDLEANQGPGLIQNNAFYSNEQGRSLLLNSSGNSEAIVVKGNSFADNWINIWYEGINGPQSTRGLGHTRVTGNTFWSWIHLGVNTDATTGSPASYDVVMSDNIYVPSGTVGAGFGYWDHYPNLHAQSIKDMQTMYGLDYGSIQKPLGKFPGQLPAGSIHNSPTKAVVMADHQAFAASEVTTPTSSIDLEIASLPSNIAICVPSVITVFGHTPLTKNDFGDYDCEVYDLQGRWVYLTVKAADRSRFEASVLPYATIYGVRLPVAVTWKSTYTVKATFTVR